MKSKTILAWEKVKHNPTEDYKKSFDFENNFLIKNVAKNSILLDVGCGTGESIKLLSKICSKIIGIDNDKDSIKKCEHNLKGLTNVRIFLKDAEKISFKKNYFDFVICIGTTFCNFGESKDKILLEIRRVLKDNGIFIFSVYNENALDSRLKIYKKYWKNFSVKEGGVVLTDGVISEQFSKNEIAKILFKNNFKILEIVEGGLFYLVKSQKL